VKTDLENRLIVLEISAVWEIIELYERRSKWDKSSIDALEALSHTFIDTPIGDEIANIWHRARGGRS
jgi:hypothetical protein